MRTITVYQVRWRVPHPPGPMFHARYLHSWRSWNNACAKKVGVENMLPRLFRRCGYRSVLLPSWFSSNRAWKTAPGGCDIHRRTRCGRHHRQHEAAGAVGRVMGEECIFCFMSRNCRVYSNARSRTLYKCATWYFDVW